MYLIFIRVIFALYLPPSLVRNVGSTSAKTKTFKRRKQHYRILRI